MKGSTDTLVHFAKGCWDFNFLLSTGVFLIKPLKVSQLFAGEQISQPSINPIHKGGAPKLSKDLGPGRHDSVP